MSSMQRFSIATPLIAAGLLVFAAGSPSTAQARPAPAPMRASEALHVLAQAAAISAKCHYLDKSQQEELAGYAAKAEVATAAREGVEIAGLAMEKGAEAGRKSACDERNRELVQAVLEAARDAMHQARSRRAAAVRAKAERNVRLPRRKTSSGQSSKIAVSKKTRSRQPSKVAVSKKTTGKSRQVARYVSLTSRYYTALRCRNMPRGKLMRMYGQVKSAHYALIRSAGAAATARAKARARQMAQRRSCKLRISLISR